jgi:hypothetical protein
VALEFDKEFGWDPLRAAGWIERRMGIRVSGRTSILNRPRRRHAELARFLSRVIYNPGYHGSEGSGAEGKTKTVEFVAVPPLRAPTAPNRERPSPPKTAVEFPKKGGAGLETDLSDPRQRTRLPPDALAALPSRGVVNYPEAEAVVRTLQTLATDSSLTRSIFVVALYPAQADLLRAMVKQSPALEGFAARICIDTPGAFRKRDADIVLVSFTRSHSHRPVAFGDGPDSLVLALTRARERLLLFGDPGALGRRSQWQGRIEHLDERASERERELVSRLVQYFETTS